MPRPGTLFATLPPGEAFRRAAELHPTLRPARPEGGVLRECMRRHGLVPAWADLPALLPDLLFDAAEAERVRNAERAGLAELKAEHTHSTYKVAGRAARPGTVVWDATRVASPAAVLSRLLKARVEVAGAEPPPDTVVPLPPVTVTPIRTVYAPGAVCVRCRDPTSPVPLGATLCDLCGYLDGPLPPADECDPGLPGDFVHRGRAPLF